MRRSSGQVNRLEKQLMRFRSAIVPLTGSLGFGALIRSTVIEGERMGQLARRLGANVEQFSKLARVLEHAGIQMNSTAMMLQRLQRRAADARSGNEQLASAFADLGINLGSFLRLDPVAAFVRLGEKLAMVDDNARRIQLAFKLLDSEGVAALQANLPQLRQEMDAMTGITERQAAALTALAGAWTTFGQRLKSFSAEALATVFEGVPALGELIGRMTGIVKPPYATGRQFAPLTGQIVGAQAPRPTGIFSPPGASSVLGLGGGRFQGGDLSASDLVLEELRAIRRNTEGGAVLQ